MRGQSGDGVWMVRSPDAAQGPTTVTATSPILARHAKRGSMEEQMALRDFIARCAPYLASGGIIDQPYQARLPEGIIHYYVVGDRVAGLGEQLVNALYPARPRAAGELLTHASAKTPTAQRARARQGNRI